MENYGIPLLADEKPFDMGSFCVTDRDSNIYEFKGLSIDVSKLPKVDAIGTGSTAYCVDDGILYMYDKSTKTWYEQ